MDDETMIGIKGYPDQTIELKQDIRKFSLKEEIVAIIGNLLRVKSIITFGIIATVCYLAVSDKVSIEAFTGIAASVLTYYFTKRSSHEHE